MIDPKWQSRFLDLANHVAQWSKDPSTQVGAVIVDPHTKNVVSFGYNGFPRGVEDREDWYADREWKYKLVVHAEVNAIMQAQGNTQGKWLFINVPSCCNECMKIVIQAGIDTMVLPKFNTSIFSERWKHTNLSSETMRRQADIKAITI